MGSCVEHLRTRSRQLAAFEKMALSLMCPAGVTLAMRKDKRRPIVSMFDVASSGSSCIENQMPDPAFVCTDIRDFRRSEAHFFRYLAFGVGFLCRDKALSMLEFCAEVPDVFCVLTVITSKGQFICLTALP